MIVDHGNVILSLNKRCKPIIDPDFMLVPYGGDGYSLIVYHNKGTSKAVNRLDDGGAAEVDRAADSPDGHIGLRIITCT